MKTKFSTSGFFGKIREDRRTFVLLNLRLASSRSVIDMSQYRLHWRYIRYVSTIILIGAASFVIFSRFKNVYYDIPLLLKEANKPLLFFLAIFQIITYLGDGWLSKILLSIAGFKMSLRDTLKIALLGVVGNHVAPFAGGAIITFRFYKKLNIPLPVISFLVFAWSFFIWISHFLFFLLSLLLLPGLFFQFVSFKKILIVILGLSLIFAVLFFLFKKKGKYFVWFLGAFFRPINKIINLFSKKNSLKPRLFEKFISDFNQCFGYLQKNKNKIPQILLSSSLFYLGDILTLYFSFLVFGFHANLALLILGYTISLILTLFTLIPGMPGIMEASLVVVFIKIGFPAHIVLFAALLFRIFSYWLPLPLGVWSWWRLEKNNIEKNNT